MSALLSPAKAARELDISERQLKYLRDDGAIRYITIGRGKRRPRIKYDPVDIEAFKEAHRSKGTACQSTSRKGIRSTITTSNSEVVDFARRLRSEASEKPKP